MTRLDAMQTSPESAAASALAMPGDARPRFNEAPSRTSVPCPEPGDFGVLHCGSTLSGSGAPDSARSGG